MKEQSILGGIKKSNWSCMDTSLEWKIVVGRICQWTPHGRRERGKPQQSWKNQVTDFMRSRNMKEDMAEGRHLWCLVGLMDKRPKLSMTKQDGLLNILPTPSSHGLRHDGLDSDSSRVWFQEEKFSTFGIGTQLKGSEFVQIWKILLGVRRTDYLSLLYCLMIVDLSLRTSGHVDRSRSRKAFPQ